MRINHLENLMIIEVCPNNKIIRNRDTRQVYLFDFITDKGKFDFYYIDDNRTEMDGVKNIDSRGMENSIESIKSNMEGKQVIKVENEGEFDLLNRSAKFNLTFYFDDDTKYTIVLNNQLYSINNSTKYLMQLFHEYKDLADFV